MTDIKITCGDTKIEVKELEPTFVFKLLKEFLNSRIETTYKVNEPVSINFPTIKENLLEANRIVDKTIEKMVDDLSCDNRTPRLDLGTSGILCSVECPECGDKYEKHITIGKLFNCRNCNTPLFHEPHVQGMYKAVKPYLFKDKQS